MKHPKVQLDCRGLPAAVAVLRIKQAIHVASKDSLSIMARLSRNCGADRVMAGLRGEDLDVQLVLSD